MKKANRTLPTRAKWEISYVRRKLRNWKWDQKQKEDKRLQAIQDEVERLGREKIIRQEKAHALAII